MVGGVSIIVPACDIAGAHVADEMILHRALSLCLEATACGLPQCHRLHLHIWLAVGAWQARRILFVLVILPAAGIVCVILVARSSA